MSASGKIEFNNRLLHFTCEGNVEKTFIGWDTSNVNMEKPEVVEKRILDQRGNERSIRRYVNVKKMYVATFDIMSEDRQYVLAGEIFRDGGEVDTRIYKPEKRGKYKERDYRSRFKLPIPFNCRFYFFPAGRKCRITTTRNQFPRPICPISKPMGTSSRL